MKPFIYLVVIILCTQCSLDQYEPEKHANDTDQTEVNSMDTVPSECQAFMEAMQANDMDRLLQQLKLCSESKEEGVLEYLLALLDQDQVDGLLKMDVIMAIGDMGDPHAVEPLIMQLEKDMTERRGLAGAIIPALGLLKDRKAAPILLKALNWREDQWLFRNMAAVALGQIGDPSAVKDLIHASYLADTRDDAIQALVPLKDERSVPVFLDAMDSGEEEATRQAALLGLKMVGEKAIPKISNALNAFSSEYPAIESRKLLVRLLGDIGTEEAQAVLLKVGARNEDTVVAEEARNVLARIK